MSNVSLLSVNNLIAGILSQRSDDRSFVFYASDSAFDPIHGSTFGSRRAAQEAVERFAATRGIFGAHRSDWADTMENQAIRNAMA